MTARRPEGSLADRYHFALASLGSVRRITYFLHVRDDFTFPEIAFRLGTSVWEVEEHFSAAMDHLAKALCSEP